MQAKVEVITLAYAKQLLDQNPSNRPLSTTTVNRYARDMKAGRWNNNGQGIVLTPDGQLLDGQHRMAAIIQSQTPVAMLVVRGVPRETFVTMDSGKPRRLSDVLAIEGHVHTYTLAGAAKLAFSYIAGTSLSYSGTKSELEAFIQRHTYLADVCTDVGARKYKFPKVPMAAVLFLGNARRHLDHDAQEFIEGVFYGEGLFKGDARLTLREWLTAQRLKERGVLKTATTFAAVGRAWNAFASGKELLVLKGLDAPSQRSMPIFGFDRADYLDVPDVIVRATEARRSNLARHRPARPSLSAVA